MMVAPLMISLLMAGQPAAGPETQAGVAILAQSYDRCMATYAVRLTRTDADDDRIFASATEGCRPLKDQLLAAIPREYPPDQARELVATIEASARPNFLAMLQRIRADRAARGGGDARNR